MKYKYFLHLCLLLHVSYLESQVLHTWNKEVPLFSGGSSHCSIQSDGDRYLFFAQRHIIEVDASGSVTGSTYYPWGPPTIDAGRGRFLRKKVDANTGQDYFLMSYRGTNPMSFAEYYPGEGFVYIAPLEEKFKDGKSLTPVLIDINDSTYMLFGSKYIRRITHRPKQGMFVNWEKPYFQGDVNSAIRTDDGGFLTATQSGKILALNADGDSLWLVTTGGIVRDLQKTSDGFIVCGSNTAGKAILAKYSDTGALIWSKQYLTDKTYEQIIVQENTKSMIVTGQSSESEMILLHLNDEGASLWRKTYQKGIGGAILKINDGYLLAGTGGTVPYHYRLIKTDKLGNTGAFEPALLPQFRTVGNSQILAQLKADPMMFYDPHSQDAKLRVPKDKKTIVFFAAALWLGAVDPQDSLHLSVATYLADKKADYRTGFVGGAAADFSHAWAASRAEIEAFRQDWADNGVLDKHVPRDLLTWPAKGNIHFTENLDLSKTTTDKSLLPAPFVDVNGDGIYSVFDGDYPRIKGDQMVWWIMTDDIEHTFSGGRPLGVDIAVSVYTYDCAQDSKIENTLFVDYEIINRSPITYTKAFAGVWSDLDMGCPYDDYIGSIPSSDAYYVYNQDAIDGYQGAMCDQYVATFGDTLPVGSIGFMNTTLNKFIYYNNESYPSVPLNAKDPQNPRQYYNYLRALWSDGAQPEYNGQPLNLFYPGNPANPNSNSLCPENVTVADRRTLGSHGPFTLAPNDTFRLNLAFTNHPNISHPCPDIDGTVKNNIDQLRALVISGALDAPGQLLPVVKLAPGQSTELNATVPGASGYLWSIGASTPSILVHQAGVYTVTITRATGCTSMETVVVQSTTTTQDTFPFDHFKLFPNPNNGQFKVEMRGVAQDEVEFTFFNAIGQTVRREVVDFSTGTLTHTFDYAQVPAGVYVLRVQVGEKMMQVKVSVPR